MTSHPLLSLAPHEPGDDELAEREEPAGDAGRPRTAAEDTDHRGDDRHRDAARKDSGPSRGLNDTSVPVVAATTPHAPDQLRWAGLADHVVIEALGAGETSAGTDLIALVSSLGGRLALCEGGPRMLAEFIAGDLIDELFLSVAPQLIGRGDGRLGLVEGLALPPASARWMELDSVRRSDDRLFPRYRRSTNSQQQEQ